MLLLIVFEIWLVRATHRLLARRRLRLQVAQTSDAHAMRRLLIRSAGHRTLSDWAAAQHDPAATEMATLINKTCFSPGEPPDLVVLRQLLSRARLR